jgi:hypothetical protein
VGISAKRKFRVDNLAFTDCDHIFRSDKTKHGNFLFPILPKRRSKFVDDADKTVIDSKLIGSYLPSNIQVGKRDF